jgi:hypothetical protein
MREIVSTNFLIAPTRAPALVVMVMGMTPQAQMTTMMIMTHIVMDRLVGLAGLVEMDLVALTGMDPILMIVTMMMMVAMSPIMVTMMKMTRSHKLQSVNGLLRLIQIGYVVVSVKLRSRRLMASRRFI